MVAYNVARSSHATLSAGVTDTVTFQAAYPTVNVLNRSTASLFVTTDGTTATVSGPDCFVVPSQTMAQLPVVAPTTGVVPTTTTVSIVSAVTGDYSVLATPYALSSVAITPLGTGSVDYGGSLPTGTTAGTVAAGDDARIVGAAQKAANLGDLGDLSAARDNLGLGTAALSNGSAFDSAGSADAVQASLLNLPMRLPARLLSNVVNVVAATLPNSGTGAVIAQTVADGTVGRIGAQLELPSTWTTVNVKVLWAVYGGTLTGNVAFGGSVISVTPGTALAAGTTSTPVTVAVPTTANSPVETDIGNFTGWVTNQWMWGFSVVIDRSTDTYNGTVAVLGLRLSPV